MRNVLPTSLRHYVSFIHSYSVCRRTRTFLNEETIFVRPSDDFIIINSNFTFHSEISSILFFLFCSCPFFLFFFFYSVLGQKLIYPHFVDLDGYNGWNLYPATKHASVALTHTVRHELCVIKAPIRVTVSSPIDSILFLFFSFILHFLFYFCFVSFWFVCSFLFCFFLF